MKLPDFMVLDPILKRARRLSEIEKELIRVNGDIKAMRRKAHALKREHEEVWREAKQLRKTGEVNPRPKQVVRL